MEYDEVVLILSCDLEPVTGEGVSDDSVMSDSDFDGTIFVSLPLLKGTRLDGSSPRFNTHGLPAPPSLRSRTPSLFCFCSVFVVLLLVYDNENDDFFNDTLVPVSVAFLLVSTFDFIKFSL